MGLQDRDYLRETPPPPRRGGRSGRGLGLPLWSVTTWIIVVTAAIFLVDRFLPPAFAPDGDPKVLDRQLATHWNSIPEGYRVQHVGPLRERGVLLYEVGSIQTPGGAIEVLIPVRLVMDGGAVKTINPSVSERWSRSPPPPGSFRSAPFDGSEHAGTGVTFCYQGPIETSIGTEEAWIPVWFVPGRWIPPIQKWLQFTTGQAIMYPNDTFGLVGFEFWRFIGYMFLHADVTHLLFNMLGLFFFGPIVETFLGGKRYFAFYLLCGIFGAVLFMLLGVGGFVSEKYFGSVPPGLLPISFLAPLIGASAGVFGVIFAAAYLMPTATVYLFGVIPMQLRTLAYGLVGFAVLTVLMKGNNAGGEAAHLGGAIAGAWFIRRPHQLHGFFDFLGRADPTSRSNKVRKARVAGAGPSAAEIDRILDKVRERGLASLDARERATLREASRRD